MGKFRIVLADDHTLIREGIRQVIENKKDFRVVGEAENGLELLHVVRNVELDMVILDVAMPVLRGVEAAAELLKIHPLLDILFLSMHKNPELVSAAFHVGAKGYLLKDDTGTELLHAIEAIRSGKTFISSKLLGEISNDIIDIIAGRKPRDVDPLSPREKQVFKLIAEGKTDRQIGGLLCISVRTVQRHHYNIRKKLDKQTTADLVRYAIEKNYV